MSFYISGLFVVLNTFSSECLFACGLPLLVTYRHVVWDRIERARSCVGAKPCLSLAAYFSFFLNTHAPAGDQWREPLGDLSLHTSMSKAGETSRCVKMRFFFFLGFAQPNLVQLILARFNIIARSMGLLAELYIWLYGLRVTCSAIAAALLRRHLMVWKVFAPR